MPKPGKKDLSFTKERSFLKQRHFMCRSPGKRIFLLRKKDPSSSKGTSCAGSREKGSFFYERKILPQAKALHVPDPGKKDLSFTKERSLLKQRHFVCQSPGKKIFLLRKKDLYSSKGTSCAETREKFFPEGMNGTPSKSARCIAMQQKSSLPLQKRNPQRKGRL